MMNKKRFLLTFGVAWGLPCGFLFAWFTRSLWLGAKAGR